MQFLYYADQLDISKKVGEINQSKNFKITVHELGSYK